MPPRNRWYCFFGCVEKSEGGKKKEKFVFLQRILHALFISLINLHS